MRTLTGPRLDSLAVNADIAPTASVILISSNVSKLVSLMTGLWLLYGMGPSEKEGIPAVLRVAQIKRNSGRALEGKSRFPGVGDLQPY